MDSCHGIYAILRREDELVAAYMEQLWTERKVHPIWINDYAEIETLLRDVKYGAPETGKPRPWLRSACDWLDQRLTSDDMFSDQWQARAQAALSALTDQLRIMFPHPPEEGVETCLLLPFRERGSYQLRVVARSRAAVSGADARQVAQRFALGIDCDREQGVSGEAFSTGNILMSVGPGDVERHFTEDVRHRWYGADSYREFRSIISIPMCEPQQWFPVGLIAVTSRSPEPFWRVYGDEDFNYLVELYTAVRRTAMIMVDRTMLNAERSGEMG